MNHERRYKIIYFDAQLFLSIISPDYKHMFYTKLDSRKLPEDTKVVGSDFSIEHNAFRIIIESKEFEEVRCGDLIPEFEETVLRTIKIQKITDDTTNCFFCDLINLRPTINSGVIKCSHCKKTYNDEDLFSKFVKEMYEIET